MGIDRSMELSIIIPTYNRKRTLEKCLFSLGSQNYPQNKYEIVVVDDGSSDGTAEMISNLIKKYKNLRYVYQYHKGPARARNSGIEISLGEVVGFIDDDCVVDNGWAKLMIEAHRSSPDMIAVGGDTFPPAQKISALVSQFLSTCSTQIDINRKKEIIFFPTCNVSFKRKLFHKYKFNEDFTLPGGEDLEFFWQIFKDGYRFAWDRNIKIVHHRDNSLMNFVRQAYIYGRGNLLVQYIHKDHPLLKELKTGRASFWVAILVNIIKIPYFSCLLGRRLMKEGNIKNIYKKMSIYLYFTLHKIFYILGNIAEFLRIRKKNVKKEKRIFHIPRLLILDITHSCNLSCRICDIWKTADSRKDIGTSWVKKALLQAEELGIREIALSGGEPLLRKDMFGIFEYARRIKIKNLGILTNGILVEQYIERLKPYLIDSTISLAISLDSLKPDIHNYIRYSNISWQKTMGSLNMLCSFKKEYPQVNFNVITIILNQNLEELLDLAIFIRSLGTNSLQFQALLPNNLIMAERKKSPFWVPKERIMALDEVIDKLINFKRENSEFVRNSINNLSLVKKYYRGTVTSDETRCSSAYESILISNQGECTTCFSSYGDIKRENLKDIFESKERIKAQEKVKKCSWPCLLPCFCDSGDLAK